MNWGAEGRISILGREGGRKADICAALTESQYS